MMMNRVLPHLFHPIGFGMFQLNFRHGVAALILMSTSMLLAQTTVAQVDTNQSSRRQTRTKARIAPPAPAKMKVEMPGELVRVRVSGDVGKPKVAVKKVAQAANISDQPLGSKSLDLISAELQIPKAPKVGLDPTTSSRRSHRIPSQVLAQKKSHQLVEFSVKNATNEPIEVAGSPPQLDFGTTSGVRQTSPTPPAKTGIPDASNSKQKIDSKPPQARVAKKLEPQPIRKPLPKLANPEQFRAKVLPRKMVGQFQEKIEPIAPPEQRRKPFSGDRQDKEMIWLNNLPRPSLSPGVRGMAMQRATSNQQVNTIMNYSSVVNLAMDYRNGASYAVKTWRSPNMSHRPIYFEDVNLERYGNGHGRFQPVVSGVKFFGTAMLLPYQVGANPPQECVYEMGYMRPGDCNPAYAKERSLDRRGLFYQLMTFGLVFGGL